MMKFFFCVAGFALAFVAWVIFCLPDRRQAVVLAPPGETMPHVIVSRPVTPVEAVKPPVQADIPDDAIHARQGHWHTFYECEDCRHLIPAGYSLQPCPVCGGETDPGTDKPYWVTSDGRRYARDQLIRQIEYAKSGKGTR